MFQRKFTKSFKIGDLIIGGNDEVIIQSMCDIKTSNVREVIKQINDCAFLGAQMMRISINDDNDVKAIKEIKENINIPLIGDIHFTSKYAIKAIEAGIDKIRINPINTPKEDLIKILKCAKKYDIAIRIGLNEGSITKDGKTLNTVEDLTNQALETIQLFEKYDFHKIVISIKSSSAIKTVEIYEKLANLTDYPLHIGVTESGFEDIGIIRSCVGLIPLLNKGIGNTIRISLTRNPLLEIKTCKRLLHELEIYKQYPTIISCPTCGRCNITNFEIIVKEISKFLEDNNINLKVAIMGCVVNGIGEGKNADIGIAGQYKEFVIFKKGVILKKVPQEHLLEEFSNIVKDL